MRYYLRAEKTGLDPIWIPCIQFSGTQKVEYKATTGEIMPPFTPSGGVDFNSSATFNYDVISGSGGGAYSISITYQYSDDESQFVYSADFVIPYSEYLNIPSEFLDGGTFSAIRKTKHLAMYGYADWWLPVLGELVSIGNQQTVNGIDTITLHCERKTPCSEAGAVAENYTVPQSLIVSNKSEYGGARRLAIADYDYYLTPGQTINYGGIQTFVLGAIEIACSVDSGLKCYLTEY